MQNSSELLHYIRFLLMVPYGVVYEQEHRPRNRQARCADARTRCRRLDLHRRRPVRPPDRCRPTRLGLPDGPHPSRYPGRGPQPSHQGLRSPRLTRRHRLRWLGPDLRQRPRGRPHLRRARRKGSLPHRPGTRGCRRHGRRLRPEVGEPSRRHSCQVRDQQVGSGHGAHGRHRELQGRERVRPPRHGLVRFDGGRPGAVGCARDRRRVRAGPQGQRRQHLALTDLRVRRPSERRALRQRRAEPLDRPALHAGALAHPRGPDRRQGLQDGPDPHEDAARPRPQGPHARPPWLVLDQHPRQPRR